MAEMKKAWYKRWWAITIGILVLLAIIGSFLPDSSNKTGNIVNENQGSPVNSPVSDNTNTAVKENTEVKTAPTSTNNYQSCIKDIFKKECAKYGLLYTDYSSAIEFITCTDDGSYTMDDISDRSKYLQIFAPTRSLEMQCGTYKEPTNSKLKCEEDLFKSKCQQVGLIYTDWSSAVGFITCTDDGIYTLSELGNENKYKQVYITQEFVDSQCS